MVLNQKVEIDGRMVLSLAALNTNPFMVKLLLDVDAIADRFCKFGKLHLYDLLKYSSCSTKAHI